MNITVEAKSSYGVKNKTDQQWYNPAKKDLLSLFAVGNTYEVVIVENKKGDKVYKNIAAAKLVEAAKPVVAKARAENKPLISANYADNKDRRILYQGLTQAVLQSPIMNMVEQSNVPSFVEHIVKALAEMVTRLSQDA